MGPSLAVRAATDHRFFNGTSILYPINTRVWELKGIGPDYYGANYPFLSPHPGGAQIVMGCLMVLLVVIAAEGCQRRHWRSLGTAHGRVTLQGKPVAADTITFENAAEGVALSAAIGPDGSYRMKSHEGDGLPVGKYRVAIMPQSFVVHHRTPFDPQPEPAAANALSDIPQKYLAANITPLTAAVSPGENAPFDFNLTP
jgi:hypothetical protein